MPAWLRQNTAATFRMGPFTDSTDGVTAETGLTIAQADIQISKNGAAFAQTSDAAPTTTHDTDGYYPIPLTATDLNTLGTLRVQVTMAGSVPVWQDFMVVPANVYDALILGSDYLQADAVQIEGADATDQVNAACDTAISDASLATAAALAAAQGNITSILADTNELQTDMADGGRTDLLIDSIVTLVTAVKAVTDNLPDSGQLTSLATATALSALVTSLNLTRYQKNTASQKVFFTLVDNSDHVTRETGATVVAQRSLDGAAFGACTGSVVEVGSGIYYLSTSAADINGDDVVFRFTSSASDPVELHVVTY